MFRESGTRVLVESVPADLLATNCWIIAPAEGEDCVLVDPGGGLQDRVHRAIEGRRLTPRAVLVTHGHFDHTMSAAEHAARYDVPVYIHAADRGQLADPWAGLGLSPGTEVPGLGSVAVDVPDEVVELSGGERLELGGLTVTVTSVPGHTPGSVIYGVDADGTPILCTGDFLFAGSIGRMDLPGGSEPDMAESLRATVARTPADAVVNPGHGPATTMGQELATNPYLRGRS